eukprot:TRINITY_DN3254_c0_g3_i3.p2 TRINITY_DN3254_c0_g3~~TRINITY_DN3254_c0_g3_i3.p2  ORF type:complete len:163 (-),score=52.26 TRINITY_DN3254_c0_g3_i3:134-622(-)
MLLEINAEDNDKDDADDVDNVEDVIDDDMEGIKQIIMNDDDDEDEGNPSEIPKAPEQAKTTISPPEAKEQHKPEFEPEAAEAKTTEPSKAEVVDPLKVVDGYETGTKLESRQKLDLQLAWDKSSEFETSRMRYEFRSEINEKLSAAGKGKVSGPFTCIAVSL